MTKNKKELLNGLKVILVVVGIVVGVRSFVFAPYIVEGASMDPTLHNHEKIFVNKLAGTIHRGEIVIIHKTSDDKNYVKRIIGLPGETIKMKGDQLIIDGKKVEEPYLKANRSDAEQLGRTLTADFGPIHVPEHHYFVMGDNRLYSMDSRNGLGFILDESIVGTPEFVFYPFDEWRTLN